MRGRKIMEEIFMVILLSVITIDLLGQRKWDGEANDGQWSNPVNWVGDSIPVSSDDVLFDNQYIDSAYSVMMPAGLITVVLNSMEIFPSGDHKIKIIIPNTNTAVPAITLSRAAYPLILNKNAIFINASGASSGSTIDLADSMKIRNGGRYIHNTSRSHAALVSLLSRAPGTEEGIFEFDVPSASVTISLSDRVFGKLVLNAGAANGTINYTAAGTKPMWIRSDLDIGKGVKLNLNCSDTFHILRNYSQASSIVNLSTTNRSLALLVRGNVFMDTGATMLRSGTGQPVLVFAGKEKQKVNIRGEVRNGVYITLYNLSGIELQSTLNISTSFAMKKGKIFADPLNYLQVDTGGILLADSLNIDTYVDGPVSIKTDSIMEHTLFPVGGAGEIRWVALKNWKGESKIWYVHQDPHQLSSNYYDVAHISTHGHWSISMEPSNILAGIQVSFNDANATGVTQMSSLTIAGLSDTIWQDLGTTGYTGSAGSNGSVISKESMFSNPVEYVTLASLVHSQNPLPIDTTRKRFRMQRNPVTPGTRIEKVLRKGTGYKVSIQSGKRQKMQLVIMNSLNQVTYTGNYNLETGNNLIYIFPRHLQFGLIHIFGLFSNYRTNTVTIW